MVDSKSIKSAFIVTINWGYIFALNCNMNAAKYFGTNADFHIKYNFPEMNPEIEKYMKLTKEAFPFKVFWEPMDQDTDYFNAKYRHADKIKDDYDSVCVLDGDLFVCNNVNKYFEIVHESDIRIVTATHLHSGLSPDEFMWDNHHLIKDRCQCAFADFPTFFDPKAENEFIKDWFSFTQDYKDTERSHPLIAMNRAIAKHYDKDQVLALPGEKWVNDINYWTHEYLPFGSNKLQHKDGIVEAIHNRWWQHGRAQSEIRNGRNSPHLKTAINNFNIIKSYMEFFNDLTPSVRVNNYVTSKFKS